MSGTKEVFSLRDIIATHTHTQERLFISRNLKIYTRANGVNYAGGARGVPRPRGGVFRFASPVPATPEKLTALRRRLIRSEKPKRANKVLTNLRNVWRLKHCHAYRLTCADPVLCFMSIYGVLTSHNASDHSFFLFKLYYIIFV